MKKEFNLSEKIVPINYVDSWSLEWLPVDDIKEAVRLLKEELLTDGKRRSRKVIKEKINKIFGEKLA